MKYNSRRDRELRRQIRSNKTHQASRKQQRKNYEVELKVKKIARNLGDLGVVVSADIFTGKDSAAYKPLFNSPATSKRELIDKYYRPAHYPTRDALTELGSLDKPNRLPVAILGLLVLYLIFIK